MKTRIIVRDCRLSIAAVWEYQPQAVHAVPPEGWKCTIRRAIIVWQPERCRRA